MDEKPTLHGVALPPMENFERASPTAYWFQPAALLWSQRTGRPVFEWLRDDDLDTRRAEERK